MPGAGFDSSPLAAAIVPPAGKITGQARRWRSTAQNNAFRAVNAAWKAGARCGSTPGGRLVVTGLPDATSWRLVESLALRAEKAARPAPSCRAPASGLYQPWNASMDAGWTQWLFENYGFELRRSARPRSRPACSATGLDVLIIADENARSLLDGFQQGAVPPQFQGGMGADGVQALDQFVRAGGTVVCLNGSSNFAIAR